jgi:membrane fusion protein (multidrug efflux system)
MKRAFLSVAAIGALVLLASCGPGGGGPGGRGGAPGSPGAGQTQEAKAVEALTVTRGALLRNVEAAGIVSGITEASVVSETQGIIQRVDFNLGDRVTKGQVLVKVEDTIARLNLEQARQQNETAQLDLAATETLFENGNASKAELIRVRSNASGAQARYETALKVYRDTAIRAPIAGYVAARERAAALGNYLSPGTLVARLVDISSLKVEVALGETQIGLIEAGAPATVRIPAACDEKLFEATVTAVAAGSDAATGSFRVVVTWVNTCGDKVKSGMSATVEIQTRQEEPVILVPSAALVEREGARFVYTVEAGRAAARRVQVGRQLGNLAEILEGLSGGETLVLSGLATLRQGDAVNPTVIGESGSWQ